MDVIRKDATITNVDDAFPGTFEVVLSAPTKDRDGDTLLPGEWKTPLPVKIPFDTDHGMSVGTTVGSGVPRIDPETGNLIVKGTYSKLPRAQEVRTLVDEGHVTHTSVAFMSEKTQKDGASVTVRELLNGAFVNTPSNREAVILSSKTFGRKAGARNSATDQGHLDALAGHLDAASRHAIALGATPATGAAETGGDDATNEDVAAGKRPAWAGESRSLRLKDAGTYDTGDLHALVAATDAAIDQAIDLIAAVDTTTLPAEVQQAIALIQAADASVDELQDALGIPDPDEDADSAAVPTTAAGAAKAAPTAAVGTATVDADTITHDLVAARKRFYATLTEGN